LQAIKEQLEKEKTMTDKNNQTLEFLQYQQERLQILHQQQYYDFRRRIDLLSHIQSVARSRFPGNNDETDIEEPKLDQNVLKDNDEKTNEMKLNEEESESLTKKKLGGPPTYIYNLFPPWMNTTEVVPAFKEKIDFSNIQLKSTGENINSVDISKEELSESQRAWELQTEAVNVRYIGRTQDDYLFAPSPYLYHEDPLTDKMLPAFMEKINIGDQVSRLKPTIYELKPQPEDKDDT